MESGNAIARDDPAIADVGERITLLGQGIGLGSIEALTLAVAIAIEEEFDIQIDDADLTGELFATIGTLATYVRSMTVGASR